MGTRSTSLACGIIHNNDYKTRSKKHTFLVPFPSLSMEKKHSHYFIFKSQVQKEESIIISMALGTPFF